MTDRIHRLQKVVQNLHHCRAHHARSQIIRCRHPFPWHGSVHTFVLLDHPRADRAYAWDFEEDDGQHSIVVLGIPPVDDAQTAVKVGLSNHAALPGPEATLTLKFE